MEVDILRITGQVAGIGGLAIGMVIIIFRDLIRKTIFPVLTKSQAFKVIVVLVGSTWSIALAGIGAWVYTEIHESKKSEMLELSGTEVFIKKYGLSTVSVIDLNIQNRGNLDANLTKLKFDVQEVFDYKYDPCPRCSRVFADGVYNINFGDIVDGKNEYLLPHLVKAESQEKIQFVLGGSYQGKSYLARVTLSVTAGSGKVLETKPLNILVQNFDDGQELGLSELAEDELRAFLKSGSKAPILLNKNVIEGYFKDGNSWPERMGGANVPALPSWF